MRAQCAAARCCPSVHHALDCFLLSRCDCCCSLCFSWLERLRPGPDGQTSANLAGWTFGYAPYTWHYSDAKKENEWEPDEQKHAYVWLLQAEKQLDERQLAGLALFNNSFGQFTQYLYYGWRFQPFDSAPGFYAKLTGGLIHGYREPYHKKIPFNHSSGWGVTAIPAVGYQFTPQWSGQVNILGKAGLMFQVNYSVR